MRRTTTALAVLVASTALAATTSAATSTAGAAELDCPDNAVCFWQGPYYTGVKTIKQNPAPPSVCGEIPGGFAQSMINNTPYTRILFGGPDCPAHQQIAEVGPADSLDVIAPHARSWR